MKKFLFAAVCLLALTAYGQEKESYEDRNALFLNASFNTLQGDFGDVFDFSYGIGIGYRINHSEGFDYGFRAEYHTILDNDPFEGESFLTFSLDAYLPADIFNNVDGEVFGRAGYSFATGENSDYAGLYLEAGYNFQICESFSLGPRTSIVLDDPNLCTLGVGGTFSF